MKILITGINGQIGYSMISQVKMLGYEAIPIGRNQWDMVSSPKYAKQIVFDEKPDLVINTAAFTNVDDAENDEATALKINAEAPRYLAKACKKIDIPLFHLSTDYVFDGKRRTPYSETDQTNPINAYGRTKLLGEKFIQDEVDKYIILRVSSVFSEHNKNFVKTIIDLIKSKQILNVVDDQICAPTSANCISKSLSDIIVYLKNNPDFKNWGIYHYCGDSKISRYEFAKIIHDIASKNLKIDCNLSPIKSSTLINSALRPNYSILSCNKIKKNFNISKCDWHSDAKRVINLLTKR